MTDAVPPQLSAADRDRLLRITFDLAARAMAAGDPPYGSLLVNGDLEVLAEAHNTTITDNDITAHPELILARWAAATYEPGDTRRLIMITSCQPCAMCANAIARAGIGTVVYGLSTDQLLGLKPPGLAAPDAAAVHYDGPHHVADAAALVRTYYRC